jgi:hypothetical protein
MTFKIYYRSQRVPADSFDSASNIDTEERMRTGRNQRAVNWARLEGLSYIGAVP